MLYGIACDLVILLVIHRGTFCEWNIFGIPYSENHTQLQWRICFLFFVRFLHAYVIVLTHNFCIGLASFSDLVGEQESEVYTVYAFTKLPRLPCMLVCYTKCTVYCLLAWRPNCRVIISVIHIQTVLKSETTSLDDNGLHCFLWGDQWISKRKIASHATMFSKWMCAWKIPASEELNPFVA